MKGTDQVRGQLIARLKDAGICVVGAWERGKLPRPARPVAVVGIQETQTGDAALWQYLGVSHGEDGMEQERYGRRIRLTVFVDFYAMRTQADALEHCLNTLDAALLSVNPVSLRFTESKRGEIQYDQASDTLTCRCTLGCSAYFTAIREEDSSPFTEFTLKGVIQ